MQRGLSMTKTGKERGTSTTHTEKAVAPATMGGARARWWERRDVRLTRHEYEDLLRRNDDRDFAATRREVEAVRSAVVGLKTLVQRGFARLDGADDDDDEAAPERAPRGGPEAWPIAPPAGRP